MLSAKARRLSKQAELKPHRGRTFKLSNEPHFAHNSATQRICLDPPDHAPVPRIDKERGIQHLHRMQ